MPSNAVPAVQAPANQAGGRRCRWLRGRRAWATILLAATGCLVLCHRPLLVAVAGGLIVDQACEQFDYVLVESGNGCHDEAAALYRELPSRRLLLLAPQPGRLQRFGILPTFEEEGRRALEARNVPREAIEVIGYQPGDSPFRTDRLGAWMRDHPQGQVLALCDRFSSRTLRIVLDARLQAGNAARIAVRGLPSHGYDESDWWHSRRGAKELVLKALALAYTWYRGEEPEDPQQWEPSQYERDLLARPGEVQP